MSRDDIIRMAREAGMERVVKLHSDGTRTVELPHPDLLERFAALVAAAERKNYEHTLALQQKSYEREIEIEVEAEREACAKVCDARYMGDNNREDMEARRCAAAIRARGQEA
jgi:hypothetical protein